MFITINIHLFLKCTYLTFPHIQFYRQIKQFQFHFFDNSLDAFNMLSESLLLVVAKASQILKYPQISDDLRQIQVS